MKRLFLILFEDGGHDLRYIPTKNGEPQNKPKGFVEIVDIENYVNVKGSLAELAQLAEDNAKNIN